MENDITLYIVGGIYLVLIIAVIYLFLRRRDKLFTSLSLVEGTLILTTLILLIFFTIMLINPLQNFGEVRNAQRILDLQQISGSINQYIVDHNYSYEEFSSLPECPAKIEIGTQNGYFNLGEILIDEYITQIPADPMNGSSKNTGYSICKSSSERITIIAINAENNKSISVHI